jgi:BirA family biotin operon repressor/biotin-[acetyl-CoA-carboxylase] ligase
VTAGGVATHDSLSVDLIRRSLSTETVGHHILLYGGVSSTNIVLRDLAARNAAEGTVVLAEEQTRGRGRGGRVWFSPPGLNLYASVLFRPRIELREVPLFSFIASLALTEAIWAEGLPASIKWPNDVLVGGGKVAGTLVETAEAGGVLRHVILGIGVNVNVEGEALKVALRHAAREATSLREAAGREIDRNAFVAAFLNRLEPWFAVARARDWDGLLAAWRARDALRDHRVEVREGGRAWQGRARGIDATGFLEVEDEVGERRRVVSGEIHLLD